MKIDRSILTANDQKIGDFGDPDKLESSINHLADVIDNNDLITESRLVDLSVSRGKIQNGAVGIQQIDPAILEQPTSAIGQQAKFQSIDEQLAERTNNLNNLGIDALYPPTPLVAIKADGVTDDSTNLNALLDFVALNGKKLILPPKVIGISSPIQFPTVATKWGIEVSGIKSETKYQHLGGSDSTIIRAIAAMPYLVTNRGANPQTDVAYYSVLKNVVLDGNNLAERGYFNGYQDKFIDSTVINCTVYGVSLGDYTNMTILKEVTVTKNAKGIESVGYQTTVWFIDKCTVRENTSDGFTISSALGAVISKTIIESNGGRGVQLLGTTDANKYINGLKFEDCYWENNTGYGIEIDRTGTVSPKNIEFERPYFNAPSKAVNIIYGDYIRFNRPTFTGNPSIAGYFVNANGNYITLKADENTLTAGNLNISGTNASNIMKIMDKVTGNTKGLVLNNVLKTAIVKPDRVMAGTTQTLTNYQVAGTIVVNSGQAAEADITLPVPDEMFHFRAICAVTNANPWKFIANAANTIYFNGVTTPKSSVQITPSVGACIDFYAFKDVNGTFAWLAVPVVGAWTAA